MESSEPFDVSYILWNSNLKSYFIKLTKVFKWGCKSKLEIISKQICINLIFSGVL